MTIQDYEFAKEQIEKLTLEMPGARKRAEKSFQTVKAVFEEFVDAYKQYDAILGCLEYFQKEVKYFSTREELKNAG